MPALRNPSLAAQRHQALYCFLTLCVDTVPVDLLRAGFKTGANRWIDRLLEEEGKKTQGFSIPFWIVNNLSITLHKLFSFLERQSCKKVGEPA